MTSKEQAVFDKHGIIPTVEAGKYFCCICNRPLFTINFVDLHVTSKSHKSNFLNFSKNFTRRGKIVKCGQCQFSGQWNTLHTHIGVHYTPVTDTTSNIYRQYFNNFLTARKKKLYCHLCKYTLSSNTFQVASMHMITKQHANAVSEANKDNNDCSKTWTDLTNQCYKDIVCNGIVKAESMMFCDICNCKLPLGLKCIFQHIAGIAHQDHAGHIEEIDEIKSDSVIPDNVTKSCESNNAQHLKSPPYSCDICKEVQFTLDEHVTHELLCQFKLKVKAVEKKVRFADPINMVMASNAGVSNCTEEITISEGVETVLDTSITESHSDINEQKICAQSSSLRSLQTVPFAEGSIMYYLVRETGIVINDGTDTCDEEEKYAIKHKSYQTCTEMNDKLLDVPESKVDVMHTPYTLLIKTKTVMNTHSGSDIFKISPTKLHSIALSVHMTIFEKNERYCLICEKEISNLFQEYYEHICSAAHLNCWKRIENDKYELPQQNPNSRVQQKLFTLMHACIYNREPPKSEDSLYCMLCNCNVNGDILDTSIIFAHIASKAHTQKFTKWKLTAKTVLENIFEQTQCSWYYIVKYHCIPCDIELLSEEDFTAHLISEDHVQKIHTDISKDKFTYDFCAPCAKIWYGNENEYDKHCKDIIHKYMTIYSYNIVTKLPKKAIEFLTKCAKNIRELVALSNNVCLQDKTRENDLLRTLENDVKMCFTTAKAYPFGSRSANLGFPESDIDVFLDTGNMYHGAYISHHVSQNFVKIVAYFLMNNQRDWKVKEVILTSRTPIIKARHLHTGLHCDISCSSGLGVENTKLIKYFNETYPTCRKLILFLKKWLHFCGISGYRAITSYAIAWCVIFYLQNKGVAPTIAELIHANTKSQIINGWETGVSYKFYAPKEEGVPWKAVLSGFFNFYANFNYKRNIICPLTGTMIEKRLFRDYVQLPGVMDPYVKNAITSKVSEPFCISHMCIQDPFDLSHNLTKAVTKKTVHNFQIFCMQSVHVLNDE